MSVTASSVSSTAIMPVQAEAVEETLVRVMAIGSFICSLCGGGELGRCSWDTLACPADISLTRN